MVINISVANSDPDGIILGSQIYIRVKSRVRIRTKMKSQIRIKVMLLRNSVVKCRLKLLFY
jgi:hypothetical protein